jgi:hypothetical protein
MHKEAEGLMAWSLHDLLVPAKKMSKVQVKFVQVCAQISNTGKIRILKLGLSLSLSQNHTGQFIFLHIFSQL